MQINNFKIKNYKKFKNKEFEFKSGVNVFYGKNEAGKTSLLSAIKTVLFADPSSRSRVVTEVHKSWYSDELFHLQISYSDGESDYVLTKDFQSKSALLKGSHKELSDMKNIVHELEKHLGVSSESIFLSSAFVSQNEISRLNLDKDLKSAIQRSLLGSSEFEPVEVLEKLKKDYAEMGVGIKGMAKNPGVIKRLDDGVSAQRVLLEKIKQSVEKLKGATTTSKESGSKLEEINVSIEDLEKQFDYQKVFDEATNEVAKIDQEVSQVGREIAEVQRMTAEFNLLKQQVDKFPEFRSKGTALLEADGAMISSLVGEIKVSSEALGKMAKEIDLLTEEFQEEAKGIGKQTIIINITSILLSIILGYLINNWLVVPVISAITIGVTWYLKRGTKDNKNAVDKLTELTEEYNSSVKDTQDKQTQLESKLEEYNCKSPDQFFASKAQFVTFNEKFLENENILKGMLKGVTLEELQSRQTDLFTKKKEIETTKLTEDVRNSRVKPEEYLKKRRDLDMFKLEKRKLEEQQTVSNVRTQDAEYSMDDLVLAEEKLESLQDEYKRQLSKFYTLELTAIAWSHAINTVMSRANEYLQESISKHIQQITEGRYSKVKIDDDLSITVYSEEKEDYISPDSLSSGTIDQIYLLARLAILDLIDKQKKCPLFIDDAFVTFDSVRLQSVKQLLSTISVERQVFLFTCHGEFKSWGSLIEL